METDKDINSLKQELALKNNEIEEIKNRLAFLENQIINKNRKLFGKSSEQIDQNQLNFFNEAEKNSNSKISEPTVEEITYKRAKKKQKGTLEIKLDNLKHVKEVYDIDEKDRICDICGTKMHRVGEEFVRHEVVYEPAKLYVKEIGRASCRERV